MAGERHRAGGGAKGEGAFRPGEPGCRLCGDVSSLFSQAMGAAGAQHAGKARARDGARDAAAPLECPPDAPGFGRATWTFLHSMAAYYPDEPDTATRDSARRFVSDFAVLYPCGYCAEHMRGYVAERPPAVESGKALSQWMCEMHNDVNRRTGKPQFDCSRVLERWRYGPADGSCDK